MKWLSIFSLLLAWNAFASPAYAAPGTEPPGSWEPPEPVEVPPLPAPNYSILEPRTPVWALSRCFDLVTNCVSYPEGRSLDACMLSVRRCESTRPWEEDAPCCAAQCWDTYRKRREAGTDEGAAMYHTLVSDRDEDSCMPGF